MYAWSNASRGRQSDIILDYTNSLKHMYLGLVGAFRGIRETDTLRARLEALMPQPTDRPDVRDSKMRQAEFLLDLNAKSAYENAVGGNEHILPGVRAEYKERRLDRSVTDLRREQTAATEKRIEEVLTPKPPGPAVDTGGWGKPVVVSP